MGLLANQAFKWYFNLRKGNIERIKSEPYNLQQSWFDYLLDRGQNTSYGQQYDFSSVKGMRDYAARVPAIDYEDIKDKIRQMMLGEADLLWPGKVQWYSKSSGTTSDKSKFIPVPRENLVKCHYKGSWDTMNLLYLMNPEAEVFYGRNLIMGGSYEQMKENPETHFGDVSAVMLSQMPFVARPFYTPDFETALLPDFEEKIERMVEIVSDQDIRMIGGVPTWTVVLFRRILEYTGKDHMLEVWPNLEAYIHGGVSFDPYINQFRRFIPKENFIYQEIYNASEGYFASQDLEKSDGMLLLLDNGIYYEFIPMEEWDEEFPRSVPLQEVELDTNYAIAITTNGGLWRYLPGDTVMFTSTDPYRIKVSGRTQQFINAFGEEVMVSNTDQALGIACKEHEASVSEYTVAPVYFREGEKGGHEWLIEFEQAPEDINSFRSCLDRALQSINSDYEAKRYKSMALEELTLHSLPEGTFLNWMRQRGKFGGQNKVPRLANHRRYVEEILGLVDQI